MAAGILVFQVWAMFMSPDSWLPRWRHYLRSLPYRPISCRFCSPTARVNGRSGPVLRGRLDCAGGDRSPPADNARKLLIGVGGVSLVLAGGVALAIQATQARDELAVFEEWRTAHQERSHDLRPDVLAIRGNVRIDPGKLGI
ncbi:MAG: hypothetical protein Ct9H300mP8_01510 [Gammaproteobacteria bacterium]|nr:MAG: hypothetical protein Ct9H300mP8_01510 [Gammaproteobacteria bacterium]